MRICIFGDSIAFGHNDFEAGGWVDRLKLYLSQRNESRVFNLGISNATTDDIIERVESESVVRKPDLIVFAIGVNDARYIETEDNMQTSAEDFVANLESLVSLANNVTKNLPLFVGLTPIDEAKNMPYPTSPSNFYASKNIQKYDSLLKDFCNENKLHYISMMDIHEAADSKDGLHPDADGHKKMFERVRDYLLEHKILD